MADASTITLSITTLPDDISKTLTDETFSYTPADATEGYYYKLTAITNSNQDLIAKQSFVQKTSGATGTDAGTILPSIAAGDKVKFLFVKHTGFTEDGTTANTADSIYLVFDGGLPAHNAQDAIEIGAGESWYGKFNNVTVADLNCISAQAGGAGSGSNKIQALVIAIIDDV
tara:strand:+ start:1306 stop:1821 length:516 start_codon:yes stop_codon:yes gene_type:complete